MTQDQHDSTAATSTRRLIRLSPTRFGVLMAVLHQERPTQRSVASEAGIACSTADYHLRVLAHLGLLTWEPSSRGTLRPLVEYIPVSQS